MNRQGKDREKEVKYWVIIPQLVINIVAFDDKSPKQ